MRPIQGRVLRDDTGVSPIRNIAILITRDVCSPPFFAGVLCTYCIIAFIMVSSGSMDLGMRVNSHELLTLKRESGAGGDDVVTRLPDARRSIVTSSPRIGSEQRDNMVEEKTDVLDTVEGRVADTQKTRLAAKPGPMKLDPKAAKARYNELRWKEVPPGTCLDKSRLNRTRLGCKKRLPHILGIGIEKCGTGALSFFLRGHPNIAHAKEKELYYWNKHRNESLDYYMKQMPYSSKYQLTMEYTPSYMVTQGVPEDIKASGFPHMRFIVMLRDPIERAVSYYLHMQYFEKLMKPRVYRPPDPSGNTYPFLGDTFESTVFRPNGEVREDTSIIDDALYVEHLERWFKVFERRQFLVIDESDISRNPVPVLKEFERFVGITPFFDQTSVFFYKKRQLWCKKKPTSGCLDVTKGRKHPEIDPEVVEKLRRYFDPYNKRLEALLGRNMSWT